ncbi:hypothetical protein [Nocardia cyriacigeorgica]|uniref:hypothetical protein n=1 Tax=Nocardia cyriacigeorgica TaxID=135487 RepID=UPI002454B093|nr:hypothetical protein [Nocardia cyriacigeorgica]
MNSRAADPARLTVVDEIFLRTHRGLGTPIALQGLWRTADRVEAALLADLHARLRGGALGRRIARPRVPGARRYWLPTIRAHPLDLGAELASTELLDWADTLGADLDPEYGPGWRLAAAPVADGGTVIALTCSHVLADARGLLIAVDTALGGHTPATDTAIRPGSDWADAYRQIVTVLRGTAAAVGAGSARMASRTATAATRGRAESRPGAAVPDLAATLRRHRAHPRIESGDHPADVLRSGTRPAAVPKTAAVRADRSDDADRCGPKHRSPHHAERIGGLDASVPPVGVVLRIRADDVDRAATESDATPNGLFIWFVANTLWASGFRRPVIEAALPVDTRDEPRVDNDLAMTSITITPTDSPADIRAKSRAAYAHRMTSPAGLPEQTLHLVPDRLAYAMHRGAGERDILCSNIGALPPSLHTFGPHVCTGIAARAIHPGLTFARRPRTRLSGYLSRTPDTYTLALVGLDPDLIPTSAALHQCADDTARRLDLTIGSW